jgi:hypothetical protein
MKSSILLLNEAGILIEKHFYIHKDLDILNKSIINIKIKTQNKIKFNLNLYHYEKIKLEKKMNLQNIIFKFILETFSFKFFGIKINLDYFFNNNFLSINSKEKIIKNKKDLFIKNLNIIEYNISNFLSSFFNLKKEDNIYINIKPDKADMFKMHTSHLMNFLLYNI